MTLILRGSRDTIPADILTDLIVQTRAGNGRLVVVDEDEGLPARFADPDIDLLLDPARGNWDFFADHDGDHDRDMTRAVAAITAGTDVEPAALGLPASPGRAPRPTATPFRRRWLISSRRTGPPAPSSR